MSLSSGVAALATRIGNYLRDSVLPRLVPAGGTTGQALVKKTGNSNDLEWRSLAAVPFYFSSADGNLTAGQQSFTVPGGYQVGAVRVTFDGVALFKDEFTATDGTTVVISNAIPVETTDKIVIWVGPALPTAFFAARATAAQIRAGSDDAGFVTAKGLADANVPVQVPYAASITLDLTSGTDFEIDPLTGDLTLANPAVIPPRWSGTVLLPQDGTGGRKLTLGSAFKVAGGAPVASTAANAEDMLACRANRAGTVIRATFIKGFA